jgi:hypothetical protein
MCTRSFLLCFLMSPMDRSVSLQQLHMKGPIDLPLSRTQPSRLAVRTAAVNCPCTHLYHLWQQQCLLAYSAARTWRDNVRIFTHVVSEYGSCDCLRISLIDVSASCNSRVPSPAYEALVSCSKQYRHLSSLPLFPAYSKA